MLKSSLVGLAALAAVLSAAAPAAAQTAPATEPYTFVAQWNVPRAQWAAYVADFDKNTKPVLEKHAAAGTLISWGAFESIVHEPDGYTHGVWWTSTSYAGIEKARLELVKTAASSASLAAATGHRDYYLRSIVGGGKAGVRRGLPERVVLPGQGGEGRRSGSSCGTRTPSRCTTSSSPRASWSATRSTSRTCTPTARCGASW